MSKKTFIAWLPAIIWMIFIFTLSSRHSVTVSSTYAINFFIFKSLHVIEYAFLYFLVFRAVYQTKPYSKKRVMLYAFIISLVYSISDEMHQKFVPSREGKLRDIFIDLFGITIAYTLIRSKFDTIKKFLIPKSS